MQKQSIWICLALLGMTCIAQAQSFTSAVDYSNFVIENLNEVARKSFDYYTYSVHEDNAQRAESQRLRLAQEIEDRKARIEQTPAYEDAESFKLGALEVMDYHLRSLNDDFANLWELRAQSQNSYEAMEKYFQAQENFEAEYEKATETLEQLHRDFADKYDITITEGEGDNAFALRVAKANRVNQYYRELFLLYFEMAKQHEEVMMLIEQESWAKASKENAALKAVVNKQLDKLKAIGDFEGDNTYHETISDYAGFFEALAETHYPAMINVGKKKPDLSQEDVNQYNKAIDFLNSGNAKYVQQLNQQGDLFLKRHIPKAGAKL